MPDKAITIWGDGPGGSPQQPDKAKIRAWGTWLEDMISAFLLGSGAIYAARAELFADLSANPNAQAWVIGDTTAANNGIYRKLGASGSGSWTRVADLPYSFIRLSNAGAGTANAIQATSAIPLPGAASAALLVMNIAAANTGAVTLAANGTAPRPVKTVSGGDLAAGYLVAGMMVAFVDDGTSFRLLSDVASTAIQAVAVAAADAAQTSEQNAATSETNAATSASNAAGSAAAAATSVAALPFNFSTATADASPGNGAFRLNNANPASATSAFIGNVDADGVTAAAILDSWDDSTNTVRGVLTIRSKANPAIRHTFNVTGAVVDGSGYRKLTLAYVEGSSALANNMACWLIFSRAGDAGEVTLNGVQTLTGKTMVTPDVTGRIRSTLTGVGNALYAICNDDTAEVGPNIDLYRNSASPAAADELAAYSFSANNSALAYTLMARIQGILDSPTAGAESGGMSFRTRVLGAWAQRMRVGAGVVVGSPTGGDPGAGKINTIEVQQDGVAVNATILGIGQTWQDVNALRTPGTSYQNTTGRPIFVTIQGRSSTTTARNVWVSPTTNSVDRITVGITPQSDANANIRTGSCFVVPKDWYYGVAGALGTQDVWSELR